MKQHAHFFHGTRLSLLSAHPIRERSRCTVGKDERTCIVIWVGIDKIAREERLWVVLLLDHASQLGQRIFVTYGNNDHSSNKLRSCWFSDGGESMSGEPSVGAPVDGCERTKTQYT